MPTFAEVLARRDHPGHGNIPPGFRLADIRRPGIGPVTLV